MGCYYLQYVVVCRHWCLCSVLPKHNDPRNQSITLDWLFINRLL